MDKDGRSKLTASGRRAAHSTPTTRQGSPGTNLPCGEQDGLLVADVEADFFEGNVAAGGCVKGLVHAAEGALAHLVEAHVAEVSGRGGAGGQRARPALRLGGVFLSPELKGRADEAWRQPGSRPRARPSALFSTRSPRDGTMAPRSGSPACRQGPGRAVCNKAPLHNSGSPSDAPIQPPRPPAAVAQLRRALGQPVWPHRLVGRRAVGLRSRLRKA